MARRAAAALCLLGTALADEYAHRYKEGEVVNLWVNKVGPYHNPQETYIYYSLPFCSTKPVDQLEHRWDYLGEVLEGNDLISSGLGVQFMESVKDHSKVCSLTLTDDTVAQLQYAVRNHYWCAQPAALPPRRRCRGHRRLARLWQPLQLARAFPGLSGCQRRQRRAQRAPVEPPPPAAPTLTHPCPTERAVQVPAVHGRPADLGHGG